MKSHVMFCKNYMLTNDIGRDMIYLATGYIERRHNERRYIGCATYYRAI